MKRFLGRKKKKVKNDADISYTPPSVEEPNNTPVNNERQQQQQQHAASSFPTTIPVDMRSSSRQSSIPPPPPSAAMDDNATTTSDANSDATSGYRYALSAYAGTIDPALSNEDGMGGGGGTLRSRSGRLRGSAGTKHRSLIPVFEDAPSSVMGGGATSSAGGVVAAAISPNSSIISSGTVVRQDRYDAYEQLMRGGIPTTNTAVDKNSKKEGSWAAIPEQPRSGDLEQIDTQLPSTNSSGSGKSVSFRSIEPSWSNSQQSRNTRYLMDEVMSQQESPAASLLDLSPSAAQNTSLQNDNLSHVQSIDQNDMNSIRLDPTGSMSPNTTASQNNNHNPSNTNLSTTTINSTSNNTKESLILQPDAIYEEHYGDAYVDGLIKYLYPAGYQSMRPRSGPWKLSMFIFLLFLWLSVFIVGHCYDRGQREYTYYFDNADDAYLQEVDDDMLVMETRWCGSKLLYFMWMVSVWITVLSMSYCSIIGYVKVRDIAVANGRSQPPGMGITSGGGGGRSDYYVMVENVSGMSATAAPPTTETAADTNGSDGGTPTGRDSEATLGYSSYQDGSHHGRYVPSIYQSDGTPQFWGGHIYRPTQAAVAMTNRP